VPGLHRNLLLVAAVCLGLLPRQTAGQGLPWLTGPALQRQLAEPVGVNWSAVPLRDAATTLSTKHRVALLIDRRVDPDQRLDLTLNDVPLEQTLTALAHRGRAGITRLPALVYLGPPETALRLRAAVELVRQQVRGLGESRGKLLLESRPLRWPDLASPRDVLTELAHGAGLTVSGMEQIPHDLWAAADLPALPLYERLLLVSVQYDLVPLADAAGHAVVLTPLPDRLPAVPEEAAATAAPGKSPRSTAKTRPAAGKTTSGKAEKRFTLKQTKGPVGPLLEQLGQRLGVEMRIDADALRRAGVALDQTVTVSVTDATLDELLHAVVDPAGMTFRREGTTIYIEPRP